jgi:DNA ligase-1
MTVQETAPISLALTFGFSDWKRVHAILDQVAEATGKQKVALLSQHQEDDLLRIVFDLTYNPFRNYYIRQLEWSEADLVDVDPDPDLEADEILELLGHLEERRLTGGAATMAVKTLAVSLTQYQESKPIWDVVRRVLSRDLRIGVNRSSTLKAFPGLFDDFTVQLAQSYEKHGHKIKGYPVAVEEKFDGVRCLIHIQPDVDAIFYSRTGKPLNAGTEVIEQLKGHTFNSSFYLDGELTSDNFNTVVGAVHRKDSTDKVFFQAFDIITEAEMKAGATKGDYVQRRKRLQGLFDPKAPTACANISVAQRYLCSNPAEIEGIYQSVRNRGGEGVIIKPLAGKWHNKRTTDWLKIKDRQTVDVPIIGLEEGTGKNVGLVGAVVVDYKGVAVKVSGLTDQIRGYFNLGDPDGCKGWLIEVEFHEETPDGSLRHPRFSRFRSGPYAVDEKRPEDGVGV